ncbi:MAG: TonB family protein [Vicinamibacterales bacterium]
MDYRGVSLATRPVSPADSLWSSMIAASVAAHLMVIGILTWMPGLLGALPEEEPREVMSISLGGAPGPRAGGMTPMGGRAVQQARPEPPKVPPPVRPPAARTPEMTVPEREVKRPPPRREMLGSAPEDARGSVPVQGPRERLGSTVADTGGEGMSLGLTTGGGGTGGEIKLGDFCCPEFLQTMLELIQRNWSAKQPVAGITTMRFTIRRDGSVGDIEVARSSGYAALDLAAQRAIGLSKFPPLPAAYPNPQLTVDLHFQYQR